MHHFAADADLFYACFSLKDINRAIDLDLSNFVQWSKTRKISFNVSKTEIVILIFNLKQIFNHLNFHLKEVRNYNRKLF